MTTRKRPAPTDRPSPKSSADILSIGPDTWHEAPTADERREANLRAELSELGYSISIPCLVCGHPLTTDRSLSLHVGPKCAAKAVTK